MTFKYENCVVCKSETRHELYFAITFIKHVCINCGTQTNYEKMVA